MAKRFNRNRKIAVRRKYKPKQKKQYKKTYANQSVISYRAPRQMPYAPRYQTKFTCGIYGSVNAGTVAAQYYTSMNSVFTPLGGASGWPNPSQPLVTLMPTGLTALLNANLYTRFRVHASKISIEFLPQALADTLEVTVTPSDNQTIPATAAAAISQPYTKSLFMSSSKMNSKNGSFISNYMTIHKFFGVRKRAIDDDLSLQFTGTYLVDPAKQLFWVVNIATPDGAVTVTPVEYRLKMTYYVELYANSTANLVQV
jgi:hypothetical protein